MAPPMVPAIVKVIHSSRTGLTAAANNTGLTVAHGLSYTPVFSVPYNNSVGLTAALPTQVIVTALDATNITFSVFTNAAQTTAEVEFMVG